MTRSVASIVLLLTTACSAIPTAEAVATEVSAGAPAEAAPEAGPEAPDTQEVARLSEQRLVEVQGLSPKQRTELSANVRVLTVNCPYTRASWQLPLVLDRVVSELGPDLVEEPQAREEWEGLRRGLRSQVAMLDLMGVDLAYPQPGDYLVSAADPEALVDRATLLQLADPVGATMHLLESNDDLTSSMDESTQHLIRRNADSAYELMGPTSMYEQNDGWLRALRRVAPAVSDPVARRRVEAMIKALDLHASQGC